MRRSIVLMLAVGIVFAAGFAEAVEVTIDPGDCGTPAESRLANLRGSLPDYWDKQGVQTRDANLGASYWFNIESARIGDFTITQNGDGLTYDLATTGGLVPGPGGDTALEEGNIVVAFNNTPVVINMGNYLGGWTVGGNITANQGKGTEKTVSVPKNTPGAIWMFYGHGGNGNNVYFKADDAGDVTIDSTSRDGEYVSATGNTIQFAGQEITVTPPPTLRDNGVNWWAIDGGGDYQYSHESETFPAKVCALFPGQWNIIGDAGMPQAQPVVPAEAIGWSESVATAYGTWVFEGPLPPGIQEFTVSDQSTGSELATNSATVDVTLVPDGVPDGYLVTETSDEPTEGWLTEAPTTYTITDPQGNVTLYGWVKSGDTVVSVNRTILYSVPKPVVWDVVFTPVVSGTVTVTWTTDIPSEGSVKVVPATGGGDEVVYYESAVGMSHSVAMTAVEEVTEYLITLVNTEWEEDQTTYSYSLTVPVQINTDGYGCTTQGVIGSYWVLGPKPYEWTNVQGDQVKNVPADVWFRVYIQPTDIGRFRVIDNGDDTYTVETDPAYGGLIGCENVAFEDVTVTFNNTDIFLNVNDYEGGHYFNWFSRSNGSGDVIVRIPVGNSGSDGYQFWWGHLGGNNSLKFDVANDGMVTINTMVRSGVNITGGMRVINFPVAQQFLIEVPADLEAQGTDWWTIDWGMSNQGRPFGNKIWHSYLGGWTLLINGSKGFKTNGFTIPDNVIDWSTTLTNDYGDFVISAPAAAIRDFWATDQTTGSNVLTNEATVDIDLTVEVAGGEAIEGYLITESDVEPTEGWQVDAPTTYAITGGEGDVTLYAWVKTTNLVISAASEIKYGADALEVSNVAVADNGDDTATVTWDTNVPAQGSIQYEALGAGTPTATTIEGASFTSHSALMVFAPDTNYKITIIDNEIAEDPFFWPNPWPLDGDVNGDCVVNILDLIGVRNHLNQDPDSPPENAAYDVNTDGSINILDMIYVRNRLNTTCAP